MAVRHNQESGCAPGLEAEGIAVANRDRFRGMPDFSTPVLAGEDVLADPRSGSIAMQAPAAQRVELRSEELGGINNAGLVFTAILRVQGGVLHDRSDGQRASPPSPSIRHASLPRHPPPPSTTLPRPASRLRVRDVRVSS